MNFLASKAQLRASFLRWALFLVPLIVLLGFGSGQFGSAETIWFQSLTKPAIFPPAMWFGIVWSVLFVSVGVALALVVSAWGAHGREIAIVVFALHFIGVLAWTPVFFGMQEMVIALYILVYAVISLLAVIAVFWRVRRLAAVILLPCLAWLIFAGVLNYQFIVENPNGGSDRGGAIERIEL
ncbi:MAG: TspO/MBR family protein [Erythrobacter sp.]